MNKLYFTYERMEPKLYPEPRDIRGKLLYAFCGIYNGKKLSEIPLSTEIVLKSIKERPILKYKIVSIDWEDIRNDNETLFEKKNFKWFITTEKNFDE